jgi:hypothetical protein
MERLRKERRPLRAAITKTVGEASVLAVEEPDQLQLKLKYRKLLKTAAKVAELDSKILDALLDAEVSEEVYLEEAATHASKSSTLDSKGFKVPIEHDIAMSELDFHYCLQSAKCKN